MSEQTKESPRGTNSSFWPREKLPELHLICLQARFFGFTRQPEGFIWCVQQGMNWSLAWILLVTPHHTVIGAALKQTVRERRRKKLRCERPPWSDSSPRCLLLDDLWPLSTAVSGCSLVFTDRWRHWWSVPHRVTCDVMMTYTYHQSKRNSDTVLVSLWNSFPSLTLWRSSDTQFCHFSCVQLRATEERLLESVCHWQHLDASSLKQRHTKHTASCDRAEGSHWDTASRALWWLRGIIQKHSTTLSSLDEIKSLINIIFFEG